MRVLFVTLCLAACGASAFEKKKMSPEAPLPAMLEGKYEATDGSEKDIPKDKPVVIAFSGSFCGACNDEAREWKSYLGDRDPQKVKILTISVSDTQAMLAKWLKLLGAKWEFGIDKEDLFSNYCQESLIPCVLVSVDGKIVYKNVGTTSHQTLEKWSGKWE